MTLDTTITCNDKKWESIETKMKYSYDDIYNFKAYSVEYFWVDLGPHSHIYQYKYENFQIKLSIQVCLTVTSCNALVHRFKTESQCQERNDWVLAFSMLKFPIQKTP